MTGKIDTHAHIVPPFWGDALRAAGFFGGQSVPAWSPESALAAMDELGVQKAIASVSRPGVAVFEGAQASRMARELNDYSAELVASFHDRFAYFASVSLPDAAAAVEDARGGFASGAVGVTLFSSYQGVYLGDPAFDPLLEYLDDVGAVAFVHPTWHGSRTSPLSPPTSYSTPRALRSTLCATTSRDAFRTYPSCSPTPAGSPRSRRTAWSRSH